MSMSFINPPSQKTPYGTYIIEEMGSQEGPIGGTPVLPLKAQAQGRQGEEERGRAAAQGSGWGAVTNSYRRGKW